jgi:hypothetical protein
MTTVASAKRFLLTDAAVIHPKRTDTSLSISCRDAPLGDIPSTRCATVATPLIAISTPGRIIKNLGLRVLGCQRDAFSRDGRALYGYFFVRCVDVEDTCVPQRARVHGAGYGPRPSSLPGRYLPAG